VYIDGSLVGTDSTASTQNTGASPITLGTPAWSQGAAGQHHNGDIWGFGMWDRALTDVEHSQLYAAGQGLLYSEICDTPSLSTRYYDFGPDAAPVKAGYQKVTEAAYDADLFGWGNNETTGSAALSFDRNWGSDDMERDFCYASIAKIFRDPTVVSGDYTIKAYCGDLGFVRDLYIDVWNDGTSSWDATTIQMDSVPSGTIQTATANITVGENGVAGLYIRCRMVTSTAWVINGLDLTPAGTPPTTGFYNPFINMIFNNDYTRRIR